MNQGPKLFHSQIDEPSDQTATHVQFVTRITKGQKQWKIKLTTD